MVYISGTRHENYNVQLIGGLTYVYMPAGEGDGGTFWLIRWAYVILALAIYRAQGQDNWAEVLGLLD